MIGSSTLRTTSLGPDVCTHLPDLWPTAPRATSLRQGRRGGVCACYHDQMVVADIFRPEQWNNFFLLVGTGAVTLTGLVFVAMSLNLKVVALNATHRNRAINTLTGLSLVFLRCALVLMGVQNHRSVGAELFVVAAISGVVFGRGYLRAIKMGHGLRMTRIVGGTLLHLVEMLGATILFFGHLAGLYLAAVAIVVSTCYMITAAWLLVIGTVDQVPETP